MSTRAKAWAPILVTLLVGTFTAVLLASPTGIEADILDLASNDVSRRQAAIEKLEKADAGDVVDPLIEALFDEHAPVVKGAIARIVLKHGVEESNESDLEALLASEEPAARSAAVTILQGTPGLAIDALEKIALSDDELPPIRAAAAVALGSSGESKGVLSKLARSGAPSSVRAAAMRGLAADSVDGAKDVKKIAEDGSAGRDDRLAAVLALGGGGSKDAPQLSSLCVTGPTWLRTRAIHALASSGAGSSQKTLFANRLGDAAADVRLAALSALEIVGGVNANKASVAALIGDGDPRVNAKAIRLSATAYANSPAAITNALKGQLANANFHVRHAAAMALYAQGDKSGANTMQADAAAANQAQALQAQAAANAINGK